MAGEIERYLRQDQLAIAQKVADVSRAKLTAEEVDAIATEMWRVIEWALYHELSVELPTIVIASNDASYTRQLRKLLKAIGEYRALNLNEGAPRFEHRPVKDRRKKASLVAPSTTFSKL